MRICLYGGPGCGKSSTAAKLYADLKSGDHSVELVSEYIKTWAYQKRVPQSFDQVYIFGKQLHAEDLVFQSGVTHLVTDSPLLLQSFYAKTYDFPAWSELMLIAKRYESACPSLNIFLDRTGVGYRHEGRYESEGLAHERDASLKEFLKEQGVPFVAFKTLDYGSIFSYVELHATRRDEAAEEVVRSELKKKRRKRFAEPVVEDYTEYGGN